MNSQQFIHAMMTDYNTVAEFYNDPEDFIAKYDLDQELADALLADSVQDISALGFDTEYVTNALSGWHRTGGYCGTL